MSSKNDFHCKNNLVLDEAFCVQNFKEHENTYKKADKIVMGDYLAINLKREITFT